MNLIGIVLSSDVIILELGVLYHLLDSLVVLAFNCLDLLSTVFDLVELLLHAGLVGFLLALNSTFMLTPLSIHLKLEHLSALILTSLELLEEGSVFKHFGAVFVTLPLHFNLLFIKEVLAFVSIVGVSFALMLHQRIDLLGLRFLVLVDVRSELVNQVSLTLQLNCLVDVLALVRLGVNLSIVGDLQVTVLVELLESNSIGENFF